MFMSSISTKTPPTKSGIEGTPRERRVTDGDTRHPAGSGYQTHRNDGQAGKCRALIDHDRYYSASCRGSAAHHPLRALPV